MIGEFEQRCQLTKGFTSFYHAQFFIYLENAAPDMFTAVLNRLQGKTVSLVERVMRTIYLRINVGKWSAEGALNAAKIRLAYNYNGFNV